MQCYRCGMSFLNINAPSTYSSVCPTCTTKDFTERETDRQIKAMEQLERDAQNRQRELERRIAESDERRSHEISELIAEQRRTQRVMQETRVSVNDAYKIGYLATKNNSDLVYVDFKWINNTYTVWIGTHFVTSVLQESFENGVKTRVDEVMRTFYLSDDTRKAWIANSGSKGLAITGADWKVDNSKVDCYVSFANISIVENDLFQQSVVLNRSYLNEELTNIYKTNLKIYEASLNTPEMIEQRRQKDFQKKEQQRIEWEKERSAERKETIKTCTKIIVTFLFVFGMILGAQEIIENPTVRYHVRDSFWTTVFMVTGAISVFVGYMKENVFEEAMAVAGYTYPIAFIPVWIVLANIV